MLAIEQRKTSIIRIFKDGAQYGDKFELSLFATYYGKFGEIVVLEGLEGGISMAVRTALRTLFLANGVKEVKWDHTNEHGHEVLICYDVVNNRLRTE